MAVTKGKNKKCKPSPNTGTMSAKTTEGASVSKNGKNGNKYEQTRKNDGKGEICFMIRAAEPCDFFFPIQRHFVFRYFLSVL